MKIFLFIFVLIAQMTAWAEVPEHLYLKETPPVELPNSARYMVYLETSQNPVGRRSPRPFWIEHLEIPFEMLQEDKGEKLQQRIHDSMVFTNSEGQKMVRWILNPEDSTYGDQLIEKLKEKGLSLERKRYFIGYSTSSRSCIVQDPQTGTTFSIKSSTNKTAGSWNDKKETVRAARAGRLMNDHIERSGRRAQNTVLGIVNEPLAYYVPEADQGIIVRQYDHFFNASQDTKLVPVFAFVHRADYYAEKSGYAGRTQEFIQETLVKMGATATAEMFMHYGIVYNSPHGQNFLVEVDKNEKPTGKFYARDYADSHLFEPLFKRSPKGRETLAHYRTFTSGSNQILTDSIRLAFGPYHNGTSQKPSWIVNEQDLIEQYRSALNERMKKTLRLTISNPSLTGHDSTYGSNYWSESFNLNENADLKNWVQDPVYTERTAAARARRLQPAATPEPSRSAVPPRTESRPAQPSVRACRILLAS